MIKKLLIIFIFTLGISLFGNIVSAAEDVGFEIIPESSSSNIGDTVNKVGVGGSVRKNYKDAAYGKQKGGDGNDARVREGSDMSLGDQFASGIMTWDTILDYAVYLVKFIGQLALLAGALGIIYFGYKKATEHLKGSGGGKLGKVVMGILVVSFAYVIVKIIWSMFIS